LGHLQPVSLNVGIYSLSLAYQGQVRLSRDVAGTFARRLNFNPGHFGHQRHGAIHRTGL
jgi:hypothetical protein